MNDHNASFVGTEVKVWRLTIRLTSSRQIRDVGSGWAAFLVCNIGSRDTVLAMVMRPLGVQSWKMVRSLMISLYLIWRSGIIYE